MRDPRLKWIAFWLSLKCLDANLPDLRFANGADIRRIRTSDQQTEVIIPNFEEVEVLDFDVARNYMFWTDFKLRKIYRAFANGTNVTEVIPWRLGEPRGLAIDWAGRHIIWCDRDPRYTRIYSLNGSRIWIAPYDAAYRRAIVWRDLDEPRAIVLDVVRGHIYWADWGCKKIERCLMDGSNRTVLIQKNLGLPNGLTIDYTERRLYWTDSQNHKIEYANLDGSNRHTLLQSSSLSYPFAITVLGDSVYWTDIHERAIYTSSKKNAKEKSIVKDKQLLLPYDIGTFDIQRQQPVVGNPCAVRNGGCSHFCFYLPPSRVCGCPTGVRLLSNGVTCASGIKKFLLFARPVDIRIYSLDVSNSIDVPLEINVSSSSWITDVAYDIDTQYVYWTEFVGLYETTIMRAKMDGSGVETVIPLQAGSSERIVIDSPGGNIFWTNGKFNSIMVARLNGSSVKTLVTNVEKLRAIAVDPVGGYIYWTAWGSYPHIGKAFMNGTNVTVLIDSRITWPNGLVIDSEQGFLYWADAEQNSIEKSDLWGRNRVILVQSDVPHIFGLTVLDKFLYWTDWVEKTVERVNKNDGKKKRAILVNELEDGYGIKAIDTSRKPDINACSQNNGNCSHLCLATPAGRSCACPDNYFFSDSDMTQCKTDDSYLIFANTKSGFIRKTPLKRYSVLSHVKSNELVTELMAVDFDWREKKLYISDAKRDKIFRMNLVGGGEFEVVVDYESANKGGLAIDWMGRNMYWTVANRNRIDMAQIDGKLRSTFLYENIEKPMAIAVEPAHGLLYFSTWGSPPTIQSVLISDPSSRKVIASLQPGFKPSVMTIDYETRRLFWSDPVSYQISVVDLTTGATAIAVNSQNYEPFGLAFFAGTLYWSVHFASEVRYGSPSGLRTLKRWRTLMHPSRVDEERLVMTVVHYTRQIGENLCSLDNGGCDHFCVSQSNHSRNCSCPVHMHTEKNADDNGLNTCTVPQTALFYALNDTASPSFYVGQPTSLELPRDIADPTSRLVDAPLPIDIESPVWAVDLHMQTKTIYWVNAANKQLYSTTLDDAPKTPYRVRLLLPDVDVYDICVNQITGQIYYTHMQAESIGIINPDGAPVGLIVSAPQARPRSLAVDPNSGHVYWTDWGGASASVRKARLDGSGELTLVNTGLREPTGLTMRSGDIYLYWVDPSRDVIERCKVNGMDRVVYRIASGGGLGARVGLGLTLKYVFYVQPLTGRMEKVSVDAGVAESEDDGVQIVPRYLVRTGMVGVTDFVIYQDMPMPDNPCAVNNGNCSHICMPSLHSYCACPLYRELKGSTCTAALCPETTHVPCADESSCVPASQRCDGYRQCVDGSDESNRCPCSANEFTCRSSDCVSNVERCNGVPNCRDGSDEKDCPSCRRKYRLCPNKQCMKDDLFCDGIDDCPDGADESPLTCQFMTPVALNATDPTISVGKSRDDSTPSLSMIVLCALLGIFAPFAILIVMLVWRRRQRRLKEAAAANAATGDEFEMNNQRRCRTESSTYNTSVPTTTECSQLTKARLEELAMAEEPRARCGRRSPSVAGISEYVLGLRSVPRMPSMSSLRTRGETDYFTLDPPMGGPMFGATSGGSVPPNPPPSEFTASCSEKKAAAAAAGTTLLDDYDDEFVLSSSEDEDGGLATEGKRPLTSSRRVISGKTTIDDHDDEDGNRDAAVNEDEDARGGGSVSVVSAMESCPPPPPSVVTDYTQTAV